MLQEEGRGGSQQLDEGKIFSISGNLKIRSWNLKNPSTWTFSSHPEKFLSQRCSNSSSLSLLLKSKSLSSLIVHSLLTLLERLFLPHRDNFSLTTCSLIMKCLWLWLVLITTRASAFSKRCRQDWNWDKSSHALKFRDFSGFYGLNMFVFLCRYISVS